MRGSGSGQPPSAAVAGRGAGKPNCSGSLVSSTGARRAEGVSEIRARVEPTQTERFNCETEQFTLLGGRASVARGSRLA